MEEQTPTVQIGSLSIFRPLWWILQGIVIGIWKFILTFVLIWQFFHILFTGKRHPWSREFTRKYMLHYQAWFNFTFWVTDDQPDIVQY